MFDVALFTPDEGATPSITLRDLIKKAADRGSHIYLIFWHSMPSEEMGYPVQETAKELKALSPNVHVLVDTSRSIGTLFWTAHIKVTVFDRKVGFAGGIDFANTRLDSPVHRLPDESRVRDPSNTWSRLGLQHGYGKPWQDFMVRLEGQAALDLSRVAVERWHTFCDYWASDGPKYRKLRQCKEENLPDFSGLDLGVLDAMHTEGSAGHVRIVHKFDYKEAKTDIDTAAATIALQSRHDLGKTLSVEVSVGHAWNRISKNILLSDLREGKTIALGTDSVYLKWTPNDAVLRTTSSAAMPQSCRVLLSGDDNWLGASRVVSDIYQEYRRLIQEATSSIYIENQYFASRLSDEHEKDGCPKLRTHTHGKNDLAELLYDKITSKVLQGEPFSAVVVFPLATEEAETQYPNLRTARCLHGALTKFWEVNNIETPLQEYFGMYHLANIVGTRGTSKFYGIFVHSKLIVVDFDAEGGGEAMLGSANINDRSLLGSRDAEVNVAVRGGGFPQALMSELLQYHVGTARLPPRGELATTFKHAAHSNERSLLDVGIDWRAGMVDGSPFFDQHGTGHLSMEDALKVGAGVHWYPLVGEARLIGHVIPWRLQEWGDDVSIYENAIDVLGGLAWLQQGDGQDAGLS